MVQPVTTSWFYGSWNLEDSNSIITGSLDFPFNPTPDIYFKFILADGSVQELGIAIGEITSMTDAIEKLNEAFDLMATNYQQYQMFFAERYIPSNSFVNVIRIYNPYTSFVAVTTGLGDLFPELGITLPAASTIKTSSDTNFSYTLNFTPPSAISGKHCLMECKVINLRSQYLATEVYPTFSLAVKGPTFASNSTTLSGSFTYPQTLAPVNTVASIQAGLGSSLQGMAQSVYVPPGPQTWSFTLIKGSNSGSLPGGLLTSEVCLHFIPLE